MSLSSPFLTSQPQRGRPWKVSKGPLPARSGRPNHGTGPAWEAWVCSWHLPLQTHLATAVHTTNLGPLLATNSGPFLNSFKLSFKLQEEKKVHLSNTPSQNSLHCFACSNNNGSYHNIQFHYSTFLYQKILAEYLLCSRPGRVPRRHWWTAHSLLSRNLALRHLHSALRWLLTLTSSRSPMNSFTSVMAALWAQARNIHLQSSGSPQAPPGPIL